MITGLDLLEVADRLADFDGEAYVRSRIGRIYYAVYLEARVYCENNLGHSREKLAREHQVIAALLSQVDPEIDFHLRKLRKARNFADYDTQLPSSEIDDLLLRVLESSAFILERLATMQSES